MSLAENLKNLAEEMIQEVKSLKDLTKEQLPLIAEEYVKGTIVLNIFYTIIGTFLLLLSLALSVLAFQYNQFLLIVTGIMFVIGLIILVSSISEIITAKTMPRRIAIKGIISLTSIGKELHEK